MLLRSLDYDEAEHAAYRWWPLGKDRPVIVDTGVNGGQPSTAHAAVRTLAVATRARRGWSLESIANDVAATGEEIEAAIEFESAA
jgi:uncharacterized protein (DUF433 family)